MMIKHNNPSADAAAEFRSTARLGPWRRAALMVAAGLVSAALAAPASAQQRVEGGRALDANTRAGSGGRNDDNTGALGPGRGPRVTGNQIITGNVTGGRQFRDATLYTDPSEFRDATSGGFSSDRFVRESSGIPRSVGGMNTQIDLTQPQAFYGSQRAAPPPAGYVPTVGASGGYIAGSSAVVNSDLRARTLNMGIESTARPGELMLPTLDQANQQTILSASPLYGVRIWETGQNPNGFLQPGQPGQAGDVGVPGQPLRPGENVMDRFRADQNQILRMRDEVNRAGGGGADEGQGGQQGQGQNGAQQGGLIQPLTNGPLGSNPANSNANGDGPNQGTALRSNAIGSELAANTVGGESGRTGQGMQHRLLVAPEKQTPQLAELRRQYERRHGAGNPSDVEATQQFNREVQAQREGLAKAAQDNAQQQQGRGGPGGARARGGPGGAGVGTRGIPTRGAAAPGSVIPGPGTPGSTLPAPGSTPPATGEPAPTPPAAPDSPAAPDTAPAEPAGPVKIETMTENVQAKGLRDLLASAEALMRQEKYAAALDKYNTAQDVAPNNPLIGVGRAHAELAASYYRRAEVDLREALAKAPHLAEAEFDLKSLVGPERLQVIVKDLKELAESDTKQPRPQILLAYIAYHTGNKDQAGTYLDAAEKRTQGDDALIKAWREAWSLPKSSKGDSDKGDAQKSDSPPDANK